MRIVATPPETMREEDYLALRELAAHGWAFEFDIFSPLTLDEYAQDRSWHPGSLCRKLNDPACPWFEDLRGDSGRLRQLRPNPELNAFIPRKERA
ncbi:MAG: hypothetical protein ABIT76_08815 [Chthoniobacterales bacterium]